MRQTIVTATALILCALAVGPALAQTPGDSTNGRVLAQKLCSNCHLVGPGEVEPTRPGTPPFEAIAAHAGQSPERIAGAIIVPHPEMPQVPLTIREIRDIVAYIMSLKR